jgi:hypothetical protein
VASQRGGGGGFIDNEQVTEEKAHRSAEEDYRNVFSFVSMGN